MVALSQLFSLHAQQSMVVQPLLSKLCGRQIPTEAASASRTLAWESRGNAQQAIYSQQMVQDFWCTQVERGQHASNGRSRAGL
eukprot:9509233-Karenia_brevis.AAC.1